jgi:hypothetical protein
MKWIIPILLLSLAGCLMPLTKPVVDVVSLPTGRDFRKGNLVIHTDGQVSENHPLFAELASFPEQVCRTLDLPVTDKLIHIYLFADRLKYEEYIHVEFKDIPSRRALFVKRPGTNPLQQDQLQVLCYWGDRIQDDLRHELTHATLHGLLCDLPLWLDEGLAMYFEVGLAHQGKHRRVLDAIEPGIQSGTWNSDLSRLVSMNEVSQLSLADYHEVWAWVHYLMHSSPLNRSMLKEYLRERLRRGGAAKPLPVKPTNESLQLHLKQLFRDRSSWPHAG